MTGSSTAKLLGVTSAKEPKDQNEMERASGREIMERAKPTSAVKIAETPIPIVISCRAERANEKVSNVASRAPIAANTTAPILPIVTILRSTPVTTPIAAPAVVPRIAGSARGLLVDP